MDAMEFGSRLRQYRRASRLSQTDLGLKAGIEQAIISRIERGEMAVLSPHAPKLASVFGISLADLLGLNANVSPAPIGTRRIPVLEESDVRRWVFESANDEIAETRDAILTDLNYSARTFAMTLRGDSMLPEFHAGHKIILDPSVEPSPGDFVVACIGLGPEVCFRQYRSLGIDEGGANVFELIPLNRLYPSLRSDRLDLWIVGTLVEHRRFRVRVA